MASTTTQTKPLTDAERAAAFDKARTDAKTRKADAAKARDEYGKLDIAAKEARAKADAETDPVKKAEANKAAQEAYQKADDAKAKAAQADRDVEQHDVDATITDANVLGFGKHPDLAASHHLAQKFGNDPANPRARANHPEVTDDGMVRLQRTTPDSSMPIYTSCHPDLVGDYMRAGWNRADSEPNSPPSFAAPRETASDGTTQVDDRTAAVRDADAKDARAAKDDRAARPAT